MVADIVTIAVPNVVEENTLVVPGNTMFATFAMHGERGLGF